LSRRRSRRPIRRPRYTAAADKPAVYAYSDNYLIDLKHAVIMDVEATTAIRKMAKLGRPCVQHQHLLMLTCAGLALLPDRPGPAVSPTVRSTGP
jgi:hypothetical protein